MKRFFANVWTKRVVSLLSIFYAAGAFALCWFSLFYDIHIHGRVSQCLIIIAISIMALVVMLYTRKQFVTKLVSFLILPPMLPVVLLYFGEWGMIIPIIVTGLLILLLSGAGEGLKTALGTVTLLLYVFGALGYFLFTSFFVIDDNTEVVAKGVSPSGRYRYRVVNTLSEETENSCTSIYVEPNYADKDFLFATFTLKNMERVVDLTRPVSETVNIEWKTQTRSEITAELNAKSEHIVVRLSDKALEKLGISDADHYTLYGISSKQKAALGKKESDFNDILLSDIPDDKLSAFNLGKDQSGSYYVLEPTKEFLAATGFAEGSRIYLRDLTETQLRAFHIIIDNAIYLNTLTDAQLAQLGVPESGDVMYFNGEICFRYYVAEIEEYFDTESRHFSLDLLE